MKSLLSSLVLLVSITLFAAFPVIIHAQDTAVTLAIPSLNLSAPVTEIAAQTLSDGTTVWGTQNLGMQIGHLQGTAWLDAPGNMVIAGHSELAKRKHGTFYTLDQMQINDTLTLTYGTETRQYVVMEIYSVDASDASSLYPTDHERMTLITCDISSYNAATGVYSKRIIVVAQRAG